MAGGGGGLRPFMRVRERKRRERKLFFHSTADRKKDRAMSDEGKSGLCPAALDIVLNADELRLAFHLLMQKGGVADQQGYVYRMMHFQCFILSFILCHCSIREKFLGFVIHVLFTALYS